MFPLKDFLIIECSLSLENKSSPKGKNTMQVDYRNSRKYQVKGPHGLCSEIRHSAYDNILFSGNLFDFIYNLSQYDMSSLNLLSFVNQFHR